MCFVCLCERMSEHVAEFESQFLFFRASAPIFVIVYILIFPTSLIIILVVYHNDSTHVSGMGGSSVGAFTCAKRGEDEKPKDWKTRLRDNRVERR